MLKTNRERRKLRKISVFWHKKITGPRPLGGRAPGAPPPLDPLVIDLTTSIAMRNVD